MDLQYAENYSAKVSMIKDVNKVLAKFPYEIGIPAAIPPADWMFQVRQNKGAKPIHKEQYQDFHHVVDQVLFLSSRAQRDIQTTVSLFTTRVNSPDEDDWVNLKHILKQLKGTE